MHGLSGQSQASYCSSGDDGGRVLVLDHHCHLADERTFADRLFSQSHIRIGQGHRIPRNDQIGAVARVALSDDLLPLSEYDTVGCPRDRDPLVRRQAAEDFKIAKPQGEGFD